MEEEHDSSRAPEDRNGVKDKMYANIATDASSSDENHHATEDSQDISRSDLAKRVLRKIDFWIIPLLFVTYNFNFMDKTILSSAAVFGLKESTVCWSKWDIPGA